VSGVPIEKILDSDVFLVSYPRSGNTWMRTIIAEIIYGKSGKSLDKIGDYVPDIHFHDVDRMTLKHPRVIKSHFAFTEEYKRVIYITRDPRDVFISYHKYLQQRNRYENSLDNFIIDICNGKIFPGTWRDHVNSWVFENPRKHHMADSNFMIIRYECLMKETEKNIAAVADFLGSNPSPRRIKKITYKSSIQHMKKKEKKGLFKWLPRNLVFINEGGYGNWKSVLSNKMVSLINENNKKEMKKLGYLNTDEANL
jgi:hypothetical protein